MKNFLFVLALLFLLALGAASSWVIVDPAGVKRTLGLQQVDSGDSTSESSPRAKRTGGASREVAQADRKEGTVDRKAARPPARREQPKKEEAEVPKVYRQARYVGPMTQPVTGNPPPEDLYPFTIHKVTYPTADSVSVELLAKNVSGIYWKSAYVVLRPLEGKKAEQFEVRDWAIDETVAIPYLFPRSELNDRMTKLRIVSVTGEVLDSALARRLSEQRAKAASMSQEMSLSGDKGPGSVRAPGLLGLLASAGAPVTGLDVSIVEIKSATPIIEFRLPVERAIPETPGVSVDNSTEERTRAMIHFEEAHKAARLAEASLRELSSEVTRLGYEAAAEKTLQPMVLKTRRHLGELNSAGLQLATLARRSTDREIKELDRVVGLYGAELSAQVESVLRSIQVVDSNFRVQDQ